MMGWEVYLGKRMDWCHWNKFIFSFMNNNWENDEELNALLYCNTLLGIVCMLCVKSDTVFLRCLFFCLLIILCIKSCFLIHLCVLASEATYNDSENQPAEDPRTTKFTWRIENFSRLTTKKLYSGVFELGDYKW